MRLSTEEIKIIKKSIETVLGNKKIILFGSRVDDNKKGGDIDLCIEVKTKISFKDKLKLLTLLEKNGIERKVDIIFKYPNSKENIFQTIEKKGIIL